MRKLFLAAALIGSSLLPMAPLAEAQRVVVVRPHPWHRGMWFHRGRWYRTRFMRRGVWIYR